MRPLSWLPLLALGLACGRSAGPDFGREQLATGFQQPIAIHFAPDGSLFVAEKAGRILRLPSPAGGEGAVTYLELPDLVDAGESGLLDFAFDPDYPRTNLIYTYYSAATTRRFRVSRWEELRGRAVPGTETILWENPDSLRGGIHFGGSLAFGPDSMLYFTTGDEDDELQPRNLHRAGGKVLRIRRDGSIPDDNPFSDGPGPILDGIWAIGLRNPFRAAWDLPANRLWVAEVGGNNQMTAWEDIHIAHRGDDFGYPPCAGPCDDPLIDGCDCDSHSAPIYSYPHAGSGAAIVGGMVYRGTRYPELRGAYIYADYVRGWIRALVMKDDEASVARSIDLLHGADLVVSLATDQEGSLYYADLAGSIWRLTEAAAEGSRP